MTRLRLAGFETRDLSEFDTYTAPVGGGLDAKSSSPKTGSYCAMAGGSWVTGTLYAQWAGLSASHLRMGFHYLRQSFSGSPWLIRFQDALGSWLCGIRHSDLGHLYIEVNGSQVATGSTIIPDATGVQDYRHVSVDVKIASSGFVALHVDGTLEALYEGDTTVAGGSRIDSIYIPYMDGANKYGTDGFIMDDVIVDEVDGASYEAASDIRLLPLFPAGTGASTQLDLTGASVNYEAVQDWASGSADEDVTYVSGSIVGALDLYTFNNVAASQVSASDTVVAITVEARVRKTNAAASTQVRLPIYRSGCVNYGSGLDTESSYGIIFARYTEDPSTGSAWSGSAAVNDFQAGIEVRP